jgi:hypothetical protein
MGFDVRGRMIVKIWAVFVGVTVKSRFPQSGPRKTDDITIAILIRYINYNNDAIGWALFVLAMESDQLGPIVKMIDVDVLTAQPPASRPTGCAVGRSDPGTCREYRVRPQFETSRSATTVAHRVRTGARLIFIFFIPIGAGNRYPSLSPHPLLSKLSVCPKLIPLQYLQSSSSGLCHQSVLAQFQPSSYPSCGYP